MAGGILGVRAVILPRIRICGKEFFALMLLCAVMLGSSND